MVCFLPLMRRAAGGLVVLMLAGCATARPCQPVRSDFAQSCRPGDWEWAGWGSCCRVECGEDGKWRVPGECVFKWCGPGGSVEFDLRSDRLKPERVQGIAARISRMSGSYRVVGYADPLERDAVPGLDLRRATAMREALVDAGVCEEQLLAPVGGGVLQRAESKTQRPWGGIATVQIAVSAEPASSPVGSVPESRP